MNKDQATKWCEKIEHLLDVETLEAEKINSQIESARKILGDECPEGADEDIWNELDEKLNAIAEIPKPSFDKKATQKVKDKAKKQYTEKQKESWGEFLKQFKSFAGVGVEDEMEDADVREILEEYYSLRENSAKPEDDKWEAFEAERNELLIVSQDDSYSSELKAMAKTLIEEANEVALEVRHDQTITVALTTLVYGMPLSQIGPSASGGGTIGYKAANKPVPGTKKLSAGAHTIVVVAADTDHYMPAELSVDLTVDKDETTLTCKEPWPVVADTPLVESMFETTVTGKQGTTAESPKLEFDPKLNTKLISTQKIKIAFAGDTNYKSSSTTTQIKVVANVSELGKEAMLTGQAMAPPTLKKHRELLDTWNTDDSPTGLKAQSKKVMSDIKGMTGDELEDYMNKFLHSSEGAGGDYDVQSVGKDNENRIWFFPNGMQVRYKPNNPAKPPLVGVEPTFSIEGKTSVGKSESKDDVAFKVTANGEPGAYGPAETLLADGVPPDQNDQKNKDYIDGTIAATHLSCVPKVEQEITWTNPPDIIVGQPLGEASLKPTAQDPASLRFTNESNQPIDKKTVLKAGTHKLRVRGVRTLRYLASSVPVEVEIVVKKKDQTLEWKPKSTELEVGSALGNDLLNAVASSKLPPVYRLEGKVVTKTTKLAAKRYTLQAIVEETAEYNSSNVVEVEITVNKKKQTLTWEPKQAVIDDDTELGDLLNATSSSKLTPVYTNGDEVVTKSTKLAPGTYQINAVAAENDEYLQSNVESIQLTVNEKEE